MAAADMNLEDLKQATLSKVKLWFWKKFHPKILNSF